MNGTLMAYLNKKLLIKWVMSMVANAYITNHNLDHAKIVDLLTIGFSETLFAHKVKEELTGKNDTINDLTYGDIFSTI